MHLIALSKVNSNGKGQVGQEESYGKIQVYKVVHCTEELLPACKEKV